jgi:hypothetical protein
MNPNAVAAPAHRRTPRRTVASATLALVVLVGCGVVGVATSGPAAPGQHGAIVTADAVGRLSPDAVHSGWRTQPGSSARRIAHRLPDACRSSSHRWGATSRRGRLDIASLGGPNSYASTPRPRGPPLTIL